jgi:CO/xanthine dehydrogenase FAD-binding subunit
MGPFDCVSARDAQHAVALLAEHGSAARLLAGGTDLLPELKADLRRPRVLIDISRAQDLKRIDLTGDRLSIGALATHADILHSALVRDLCPVLAEAARTVGAVQTRNLGTIGGNLAHAVPSMDLGPALLALDATVTIASHNARRAVPLERFFLGPRRTALAPDEMMIEVSVPVSSFGKPIAFLKFGLRKGQALALVNVAAGFFVAHGEPLFKEPRIALGAVAPTIMRARTAERFLSARLIDQESMAEAGRLAAEEARPIDDFRASAAYRRELVAVLARRALERAWERARSLSQGREA